MAANREALVQEAKIFGIKQRAKADRIVAEVSRWEEIFREFAVLDRDMKTLGRDSEKRLARIEG